MKERQTAHSQVLEEQINMEKIDRQILDRYIEISRDRLKTGGR